MKRKLFITILLIGFLFLLCPIFLKHDSHVTLTCITDTTELEDVTFMFKASNGWTIVDTISYSPIVERVSIYDKHDNLVMLAGNTSEGDSYNFVKIQRDRNMKISGLLYCEDLDATKESDYDIKAMEHFVNQVVLLPEDSSFCTRFKFSFDDDGDLIKVYDPQDPQNCIIPLEGCKLEYEIRENVSFWGSDLFGGFITLFFRDVPKKGMFDYNGWLRTFFLYQLQTMREMNRGTLVSGRLYDRDGKLISERHRTDAEISKSFYTSEINDYLTFDDEIFNYWWWRF